MQFSEFSVYLSLWRAVMQNLILMLTTLPDAASAQTLAARVVDARLAACATCLAAVQSTYRWAGKIETASEMPVLFKTSAACADALETFIAENHSYQVPEIVRWSATASPAYAQWVAAETNLEMS
jgi:periplasmic divalent cation tolerance protein